MPAKGQMSHNAGPDWHDIQACLEHIRSEMGLECRVIIRTFKEDMIQATVEVYREVSGERMGIAKETRLWPCDRHKTLEGAVLACCHYVYNRAWELVYNPQTSQGRGRR